MRIMDINENTVFHPIDFDTDRYIGMSVFNRKGKVPATVMMSKHSDHPHYMVVDGLFRQLFFTSYKDAVDYCESRGYVKAGR